MYVHTCPSQTQILCVKWEVCEAGWRVYRYFDELIYTECIPLAETELSELGSTCIIDLLVMQLMLYEYNSVVGTPILCESKCS